jgi:lycopene beta-cyclase
MIGMMAGHPIDIVIAGGGLPGALAALALAKLRPDLRLALVEPGASAGGGRYWPFMLTDIPPDDRWLVEPLINGAWRKYEVRFPRFERVVRTPCRVITGEKLDAALREALPEGALITGEPIIGVDAQGVSLADGRRIDARAVIDARPGDEFPHLAGGWRVTLGRMVRLADRHPFAHPLLMDLRVSQREGFRYISCVPIDGWRVLVSTSWYTDTPDADYAAMAARIDDYCRLAKWDVAEVRFEQREVLPVVAAGDFDAFWASGEGGVARLGMWAGLTHPLTGSELGPAVSAAWRLA